ncbi:MAG: LytTR family transcriptional regulator DNA-binding domain-containing protein [Flavobacteriaceae bacterium]
MIAVLSAHDSSSINYHLDGAIFISLFGYFCIFIVYKIDKIINQLNIKYSNSIFFINFSLSFLISSSIIIFISWIFNGFVRDEWALQFVFVKQQMILLNFLLIIILSYLTISYFTRSVSIRNKKLKADNLEMSLALHKYLTRIPSLSNKKTTLIPVNKVSYFKIDEGVLFAYTSKDEKHPLTITTLNVLESKLNPTNFFRINRSEIININKVESYEPYLKDRLAIKLSHRSITLYTSNAKSASFREWVVNSTA